MTRVRSSSNVFSNLALLRCFEFFSNFKIVAPLATFFQAYLVLDNLTIDHQLQI